MSHALVLFLTNVEQLVHAFIKTSRLDYCNTIMGGCPARLINKLQLVQNAAAWVLTRTRNYDHISPVLSTLNLLPIKHCIHLLKNIADYLQSTKWFSYPVLEWALNAL